MTDTPKAAEADIAVKEAVKRFTTDALTNLDVVLAVEALDNAIKAIDKLAPLDSPSRKTLALSDRPPEFHLPTLYLARVRAEEARMYLDRFHNSRHLTWTYVVQKSDGTAWEPGDLKPVEPETPPSEEKPEGR